MCNTNKGDYRRPVKSRKRESLFSEPVLLLCASYAIWLTDSIRSFVRLSVSLLVCPSARVIKWENQCFCILMAFDWVCLRDWVYGWGLDALAHPSATILWPASLVTFLMLVSMQNNKRTKKNDFHILHHTGAFGRGIPTAFRWGLHHLLPQKRTCIGYSSWA